MLEFITQICSYCGLFTVEFRPSIERHLLSEVHRCVQELLDIQGAAHEGFNSFMVFCSEIKKEPHTFCLVVEILLYM